MLNGGCRKQKGQITFSFLFMRRALLNNHPNDA